MTSTRFSRRHALRLVLGASAGAMMLTKASPIAIAQTDDDRTVNTDILNLRSGAGLSFDIIESLPLGTPVMIDSSQRIATDGINWIFVTVVASSNQGFVDSRYLSMPDAETEPGTPAGETSSTKFVSVADANLRDTAGFVSAIVAMLPIGQAVTVTGDSVDADGYTWHPVSTETEIGWMADIVLSDSQPATPGFETGAAVSINTDLLNLRNDPGVNTGIIETYTFGTTGTIISLNPTTADDLVWHQVSLDDDGATGWLAEMFLSASGGGDVSGSVEISDGPVNLRDEPTLSGSVLATVSTGDTASLITGGFTAGDGYQWINVTLDDQSGQQGWIASEFVTFI
ncbi:MAG: hypothetical protein WKF81_02760 [Thermomicrobiales bacterium]